MRDIPAIERNPPSDMMLKRGDRWIRIRHNSSRFLGFLLLCLALVLASYLTLQSDDWNLTRHLTRLQMQELHARKNGSLDGSEQAEDSIRQMRTLETGSTPVDTIVKMNEAAIQMSPDSLQILNFNWSAVQEKRLDRMKHHCALPSSKPARDNVPNDSKGTCQNYYDGIFIDRSHKMVYCAIPKVASSSIKLAVALMTHRLKGNQSQWFQVHNYRSLKGVGLLNLVDFVKTSKLDAIEGSWNSMNKFLIVRHPFERLLSAYLDKFTHRNRWTDFFQERFGKLIIDLYREKAPEGAHHNVTFAEFVRFLIDDRVPCPAKFNPHWATYNSICHPCRLKYNRIVRHESLREELEPLWKEIYHEPITDAILRVRNAAQQSTRTVLMTYMATLTDREVARLYEVYRADFEMFGYHWPPTL